MVSIFVSARFGFLFVPIIGNITLLNILIIIIGLILIWIIVSIPVYIAGKLVTGGESSLGDAMVATLFGPIVYAITLLLSDYLLGAFLGPGSYVWGFVIAFIAWVGVFKASFGVGWLRAFAIAVLAIVVFTVISFLFGAILGVVLTGPFFPRL